MSATKTAIECRGVETLKAIRRSTSSAAIIKSLGAERATRAAQRAGTIRDVPTAAVRCLRNITIGIATMQEMTMPTDREILRSALVELVGCDGREELEQMEIVLRMAPAPAEDKAAAINGIHALLATLPVAAVGEAQE